MTKRYPGVTKRGDTWHWRAQFSEDGHRSSLSGGGFPTAKEAAEARTQALRDAVDHPSEVPDITLAEYLDRWVDAHAATVRETSASQYRSRVSNIKATSYADRRLRDLDEMDYRHLIAELRAQAPGHRTLTVKVACLSQALNVAVRQGLLRHNPVPGITVARTNPLPVYTPWTAAEAQRFLAHRRKADDPLFHAWHLALATGLRRGELHGLRWDDLDGTRLWVRRQRTDVRGQVLERATKTDASEAPVVLDARTLEVLDEVPRTSGYVVNDPRTGQPYGNFSTFRSDFQRAVTEAGVPMVRFHDLRHTCASLLANAGVPLAQAQQRLRHWSPAMTRHYTHADPDAQAAVAEKLGDLLA